MYFWGMVLSAVGVGLAWVALRWWSAGRQASSWAVTQGTVVSVDRQRTGDESDGYSYAVRVQYRYWAQGRWRQSASICPGGAAYTSVERWLRKDEARYPVRSTVEVRYDPADPDRAFLELWPRSFWWLMATALVFGGLGAWFLIKN